MCIRDRSNISYTELRKLLVTAKPELLAQQIRYAAADDDADTIITGKGIKADTMMESLLNAPNNIDIWKTLRKTIAQHNDKEKGRHPLNFIYCLIDELKKRGIINEEICDSMNRDVYRKLLAQLYTDMDHVHGSGIWSTITRKIVGAASKGVAGFTTKQVANKAVTLFSMGQAVLCENVLKRWWII